MPTYALTIFKTWGGEQFTNQYKLTAPSQTAAVAAGSSVVLQERTLMYADVTFNFYRVSVIPDPTRVSFVDNAINLPGLVSTNGVVPVPFELCGVVAFSAGSGSLGKKYFRRCINGADVTYTGEGMTVGASTNSEVRLENFAGAILTDFTGNGAALVIGKYVRTASSAAPFGLAMINADKRWHNREKAGDPN